MIRRPPRSTRTDTLFPYTTLFRSLAAWLVSLAGVEDAWRYIFAVTALPALVGVGLRFLVPESPLYLMRTGRLVEAKSTIDQILVVNGKTTLPAVQQIEPAAPVQDARIFSGPLRQRSMMILAIWFLVSVSYYGVFTWMPPRLAGEGFGFVRGYGFLVLVTLAQLPGYALAAYGVEKWGRRPTLIGFCLPSAAGCLLFVTAVDDMLIGGSLVIMSFALLGTWGRSEEHTSELQSLMRTPSAVF